VRFTLTLCFVHIDRLVRAYYIQFIRSGLYNATSQNVRNRNLTISRAPLKSQGQGTSLFTSAATNQRGCPKGSP